MAIKLRANTPDNTGKGSELTYLEMDTNLESFYFSSSLAGTDLILHTTGSAEHTIDLSGIVGSGTQGTQGTTGPQGTQGTTGTQGVDGVGTQGTQGITGTSTQGDPGAPGDPGPQGTQGIQGTEGTGTQGDPGAQGTQGIAGTASAQGVQGTQGIQGTEGTGTQGTQGIAGTASAQGAQGTQGTQGTTGTGTQGVQGITGTGTQGIQGTEGTGTQGTQGTTGTGTQGVQGITGTGTQGVQGITGTGTPGTQGVQGIQGTSASSNSSATLGSSSSPLGDHTDGAKHTVQTTWTRLSTTGASFTNSSGGTKSYLVVLGLEMTSTYTQSGVVPFGIDIKFADIASGALTYTEWRDTVFMSYASEVASRVTKTYVSHAFQLDNGADFAVYVKGTPYLAQQLYVEYALLTVTELTGTPVAIMN